MWISCVKSQMENPNMFKSEISEDLLASHTINHVNHHLNACMHDDFSHRQQLLHIMTNAMDEINH